MRTPAGYVEIALNWDEYFDDEANVSTDESGKNVKKCALLYYFYSVETGASVFDGPKESVSEYDDGRCRGLRICSRAFCRRGRTMSLS